MYKCLLFIITFLANFNILVAEKFFSVSHDTSNKIILHVNLPENSSIAWKYAGQMGEKTEIKLHSKENLESYNISWPFPKKATIAGKYLSYYYDSNFAIPIILNATDQNKEIKFSLQISGVLCRDNQCEKISENIENITIHPHKYIEDNNKFEDFEIKSLKLEQNTAIFTILFTNSFITKWPDFIVEPTKKIFLGFGEVKSVGEDSRSFVWEVPLLQGYKNYIGQDFTIYSNQNQSRGLTFKFQDTSSVYNYNLMYIVFLPLLIGFGLSFLAEPGFLTGIIKNSYNANSLQFLRILWITFLNFSLIGILELCVTNIVYLLTSIPTYFTILIIIFAIFWSFYAISKDQDILPKYLVQNFIKLTAFLRSKLSFLLKNLQFKKLFILVYLVQIFCTSNGIFVTLIFSFFITLGFLSRYLYNRYLYNIFNKEKFRMKLEKKHLGYIIAVVLFLALSLWMLLSSSSSITSDEEVYKLIQYNLITSFLNNSSLYIFSLAFLAGVILNFMPCVLPVLSLKIISILQTSNTNNKAKILATIAGILFTFLTLALISISFKFFGMKFGLVVTFQQPYFIIAIIIILTFFICSLLDQINITLPNALLNIMVKTKFNSEIIHNFFLGILAAILSTPCTAPFLGTVMFFAMTENVLLNIGLFLTIGLGFSLPYILLLIFPKLLNFLPKPGAWMSKLKTIMAILLIGTIIWLLNILYSQLGTRAVIIIGLMIPLIRYFLEIDQSRYVKIYKFSSSTTKLLTLSILVGLTFYLPYQTKLEDNHINLRIGKFWQNFDQKSLDQMIAENKVIFIDITADWCSTCMYNKLVLLDRDHFFNLLKSNDVLAMRGDITLDDNPSIGKFLEKYQKYGIPFNLVYGPGAKNGIELPVLLSYNDVKNAIKIAKGD